MELEVTLGTKTHKLRLMPLQDGRTEATLDGRTIQVDSAPLQPCVLSLLLDGRHYSVVVSPGKEQTTVSWQGHVRVSEVMDPRRRSSRAGGAGGGSALIRSPMPGRVIKLLVAEGDTVAAGTGVIVVEAMKMQNELKAGRAGVVKRIFVQEGANVEKSAKLLELGEAASA